ncbi:MAG: RidA family protein [Gammaproteobacteria bacterium]|nr:RidA family protein [Gammaproteobacteria bacterium]MDH3413261.1 RidA family protein [Gammaproteobacteria bacterium]
MSIERLHKGPRMSQAVKHGGTVYLAGQVALDAKGGSAIEQTRNILDRIDKLLAEAGSNKSKLISATIWLADIALFNDMNKVWDAWIDPENPPTRACVESKLAAPDFTVEIAVIAAE